MCSSKKGVSAHQLHRTLGITYEAAWFMAHRIREAMRAGGLAPLGGGGKIVEADETYYGNVDRPNCEPTNMAVSSQPAKATSGRSLRWSSAAATSAPSMFRSRTRITSQNRERKHCPRIAAAY